MLPQQNSLLDGLASVLGLLLTIYMWMIIIRAVISWVNPNPYNQVVRFLDRLTEPALRHVRRILPFSYGGLDFSPIILILIIIFANDFVVTSLRALGHGQSAAVVLPLFLVSFIRMMQGILFAYMIVVIARAVISWISPDPYNMIVRFIYGLTEPVLYRLRSTLPLVFGGLDLSPIALLAVIYFLNIGLSYLQALVIGAFG